MSQIYDFFVSNTLKIHENSTKNRIKSNVIRKDMTFEIRPKNLNKLHFSLSYGEKYIRMFFQKTDK